jgi:hypothetical protein
MEAGESNALRSCGGPGVTKMAEESLNDAVLRLIDDFITSVGQLDMLLLLSRNPTRTYTGEQAARVLHISESVAKDMLFLLYRNGFAQRTQEGSQDHYNFQPRDIEFLSDVQALESAYSKDPGTIVTRIYQKGAKTSIMADAVDHCKFKLDE